MYTIVVDGSKIQMELSGMPPQFGSDEILADRESDILGSTPWYSKGYTTARLFSDEQFERLTTGITETVRQVLIDHGVTGLEDFTLPRYHRYVTTDELHQKVIETTRDLTLEDIDCDLDALIEKLSGFAGHKLSPHNNILGRSFVIVRINRPLSNDYNPPHKDGYLALWQRTVNIWIPIAGVTKNSGLPVVEGSHLIPESKIKRTAEGAFLNGKPYRVPAITEWDGRNEMSRPSFQPGEGLLFSPLLIHGCAKNFEPDTTRVALEMRLSSID